MSVEEKKIHPIQTEYKKRLQDTGLTEETNTRQVFMEGHPRKIPIFFADEQKDCIDIPYVLPNGEMEAYMEGKKMKTFSRLRYRKPKEYKTQDGSIRKAKYNQPPKSGIRSYCPPAICEKYRKEEEIRTLVIVEGEFKSIAGSVFGLDIMGIGGIHNFRIKDTNELEENIRQVIETCKVQNVILLFDADCLKIEYKNDKTELTTRLESFHLAVTRFYELLKPFKVDFYFAHIQTKYLLNAKGLDDLLSSPFMHNNKKARQQLKLEFDKLSTGHKEYITIQHITAASLNKLRSYFYLSNVKEFYEAYKEVIQDKSFLYNKKRYYYDGTSVQSQFIDEARRYLRIGIQFYKKIWQMNPHKDPKYQKPELLLEPWSIGEINRDYQNNKDFINHIPKYDQFCNLPDNTGNYKRIIEVEYDGIVSRSYNVYNQLTHEMKEGSWENIEKFLRHIFQSKNTKGESLYEFGLDYIQLTYFKPMQRLPILCPVSKERNTGKSTFLNFLQAIFKENMSILDNERFTGKFTSHFVYKLIVALDEGFIPVEQKLMKERIKNYSTGQTVWQEGKGTNATAVHNFMHLIMCSNDETNFMQIDEGENRFAVLKVPTLSFDDPGILKKMEAEIPAFLYFLSKRKLYYPEEQSRFSFHPSVYETEALKAIQERTQNFLPKQIRDYIKEQFLLTGLSHLELSAVDIVKGVFEVNQIKLPKPAVIDYLKYDLALRPKKRGRYKLYYENPDESNREPYLTKSVTGYPYEFFYQDYLDDGERKEIEERQAALIEPEDDQQEQPEAVQQEMPFPPEESIKHKRTENVESYIM